MTFVMNKICCYQARLGLIFKHLPESFEVSQDGFKLVPFALLKVLKPSFVEISFYYLPPTCIHSKYSYTE
jgi:hypothetical protein